MKNLDSKLFRKKFFDSFFHSFLNIRFITILALLTILFISAFILIVVRFNYKIYSNQEKNAIVEQNQLDEKWTQIVIEYSTLASTSQVEDYADESKMHLPTKKDIKYIVLSTPLNNIEIDNEND